MVAQNFFFCLIFNSKAILFYVCSLAEIKNLLTKILPMQCFKIGLVGTNSKMDKIAWNDVDRWYFFGKKKLFQPQSWNWTFIVIAFNYFLLATFVLEYKFLFFLQTTNKMHKIATLQGTSSITIPTTQI